MTNQPLSTIGVGMPEDFDTVSYEAVHSRAAARKATFSESYSQFAAAWKAVAYRFKFCAEHDLAFTKSIKCAGDAPLPPERYIQERELFYFFIAGLAVIESLCYGLFSIASMLDSNAFPISAPRDLRCISPERTAELFEIHFRGEGISASLKGMIADNTYRKWKDIRNILAHRVAPGRIIYLSASTAKSLPPSAQWKTIGKQLDENTTSSSREWLAETVRTLLRDTDGFTASRLP